jgi:hypothetical protein
MENKFNIEEHYKDSILLSPRELMEYIVYFGLKDNWDKEKVSAAVSILKAGDGISVRIVVIDGKESLLAEMERLPEMPPITGQLIVPVTKERLSDEQILKVETWIKRRNFYLEKMSKW